MNYLGSYQSISRVWDNIDLTTYLVTTDIPSRRVTTQGEDRILPSVFTSYVTPSPNGCRISIQNTRTSRLYLTAVTYIEVVIPWLANTNEFNEFFEVVSTNNKIVSVRYLGEVINLNALRWHLLQS